MRFKENGGNGEPLERFLKRMIVRWDAALSRIDALERKHDHMLKYLLRREQRDTEARAEDRQRWADHQADLRRRWDEQQRKWDEQQRKWDENQRRWEENQKTIRRLLTRRGKS